ncbi:MAG: hypothetical protein ACREQV_07390 [Candidatus Binatia bacterium]
MKLFVCAAAILLSMQAVHAGDFDGSKKLMCATIQAMDCVSGQECVKGRPGDIGAPKFLKIDFAQKALEGPKRTTPIAFMDKGKDQIVLQGNELGFGWTIALDQEQGDLIATMVNRDGAFVLFGSCTPL